MAKYFTKEVNDDSYKIKICIFGFCVYIRVIFSAYAAVYEKSVLRKTFALAFVLSPLTLRCKKMTSQSS